MAPCSLIQNNPWAVAHYQVVAYLEVGRINAHSSTCVSGTPACMHLHSSTYTTQTVCACACTLASQAVRMPTYVSARCSCSLVPLFHPPLQPGHQAANVGDRCLNMLTTKFSLAYLCSYLDFHGF